MNGAGLANSYGPYLRLTLGSWGKGGVPSEGRGRGRRSHGPGHVLDLGPGSNAAPCPGNPWEYVIPVKEVKVWRPWMISCFTLTIAPGVRLQNPRRPFGVRLALVTRGKLAVPTGARAGSLRARTCG